MVKKQNKQFRVSPAAIKTSAALIAIVLLMFFLYRGYKSLMFKSGVFTVRSVVLNSDLDFIDKKDVAYVKGKNIFSIDLKELQKRLSRKYPQTYYLSVIRRYPNQIYITARKRQPFVQVGLRDNFYLIDDGGVVINRIAKKEDDLPYIEGARIGYNDMRLGGYCNNEGIKSGILIVKAFSQIKDLASFKIKTLDVSRFSQIEMLLDNELKVILDSDKLHNKMAMLGIVLTETNFDLNTTEYVDLRFKQPIRGKKAGKNVKQNKSRK